MNPEIEKVVEASLKRIMEDERRRHLEMFQDVYIALDRLEYQNGIPTKSIKQAITDVVDSPLMAGKYRDNASSLLYFAMVKGGRNKMGKHIHQAIIDDDFDSTTTITIFDSEETSALEIVRNTLGLRWHNHQANPANERERKYRDSGLWSWRPQVGGGLHFSVAVGCACEHDCCGHLCGLSYSLSKIGTRYLVLITDRHFNF